MYLLCFHLGPVLQIILVGRVRVISELVLVNECEFIWVDFRHDDKIAHLELMSTFQECFFQ